MYLFPCCFREGFIGKTSNIYRVKIQQKVISCMSRMQTFYPMNLSSLVMEEDKKVMPIKLPSCTLFLTTTDAHSMRTKKGKAGT